jgi:hypothetical protein
MLRLIQNPTMPPIAMSSAKPAAPGQKLPITPPIMNRKRAKMTNVAIRQSAILLCNEGTRGTEGNNLGYQNNADRIVPARSDLDIPFSFIPFPVCPASRRKANS